MYCTTFESSANCEAPAPACSALPASIRPVLSDPVDDAAELGDVLGGDAEVIHGGGQRREDDHHAEPGDPPVTAAARQMRSALQQLGFAILQIRCKPLRRIAQSGTRPSACLLGHR